MKTYPSISHWRKGIYDEQVYAFDKLDGSNIRAEWTKKNGWCKFGSRTQLLQPNQEPIFKSINIFLNKYGNDLEKKFRDDIELRRSMKYTVFFEFFGDKSFGGIHEIEDNHDVVLFDVHREKKGIMLPKEFIKYFGHLHTAELVYHGEYNSEFIEAVQNNNFGNHNFIEGVVCKGTVKTKKNNVENIWMSKVKTFEWLEQVKIKLGQSRYNEEI